ncbi:hypothetical protein [Haladaptatus sp. R4]|uniref:hypothetical protein n=1 Tax=Haladaptatus sp. R4 TaxID=1679489 RepID=UPI000AC5F1E4|nr:hypothetical protein [Haladaptatus sp. R4]
MLTDEKNVSATYQQLTLFIEEYVERSGAEGVVVGMSGGVDSTLAAYLAVEALGSDRVFGLLLPCNLTAEAGSHDALTVGSARHRLRGDSPPTAHSWVRRTDKRRRGARRSGASAR